jgi:hypothetical protein
MIKANQKKKKSTKMKTSDILMLLAIFFGVFLLTWIVLLELNEETVSKLPQNHLINPPPSLPPPPSPPPPVTPTWTDFPPLREVDQSLGKVLGDIESHMPAWHIYRSKDKITWAHETSHGLSSRLRTQHVPKDVANGRFLGDWVLSPSGIKVFRSFGRTNGFYVLEDRAVIIIEPDCRMTDVALVVPRSLRGEETYPLYMIRQARSWNDQPLYIFDEWVAYSNGSAVRADLKIQDRGETVKYMLDFCVYSLCLAWVSKNDDDQFKFFLKWHLKRSMELWEANQQVGGDLRRSEFYWKTLKTSDESKGLRDFARPYLGEQWTKENLGF